MHWNDVQQRDPQRAALLRRMLNAGFSSVLARQLLDRMPANGVQGVNHALIGSPPFSLERYRRWLTAVAELDGAFDAAVMLPWIEPSPCRETP